MSQNDSSEQKKDRWMGYLALSTAIMAVLAALTTLYMGKYSSRAILAQGQESDQWAFYQAKSIKQHTFDLGKKALELQYRSQKGLSPMVAAEYEKTVAAYGMRSSAMTRRKRRSRTKPRFWERIS